MGLSLGTEAAMELPVGHQLQQRSGVSAPSPRRGLSQSSHLTATLAGCQPPQAPTRRWNKIEVDRWKSVLTKQVWVGREMPNAAQQNNREWMNMLDLINWIMSMKKLFGTNKRGWWKHNRRAVQIPGIHFFPYWGKGQPPTNSFMVLFQASLLVIFGLN